jgi:hypothetical protein
MNYSSEMEVQVMNGTFKKIRLALVAFALILAWAMGYGAASRARGAVNPGQADLQQVAAIAAERDRALAELAAARKRHQIARRGIQRLVEELAYVEEINKELRRELESRSAGGRGGLSAAGPMQ